MTVVNIEFMANANFGDLRREVERANASLATLHTSINKINTERLASAFSNFEKSMVGSGKFHMATTQVISNTEKFGQALAQQKLSLSEYHRATSDFIRGRDSQIKKLAAQQVAMERSLVITRGRTASGAVRADVLTPNVLNETATKTALARKEMQIFNKVLNYGATSIINWGKNTQWAGRQLTVGLTVPLTIFGAAAAKMFLDADKQLVRMVKVYGDANTNLTNEQTAQLRKSVMNLGTELASAWGVSINETLGLAADLAAVGKQGQDLLESTTQTTRLMVLGEVDRQTAMKTTLAIQSAFKENNEELADSINFLNAVENQTSASLEDLTTVIPKAGPVVRGLGGDVKDLALMFVAMKEGGVPAAEGANAIKSGLASLINPTKKASEFLAGFNINIQKIIGDNQGKIVPTLMAVKEALDSLDPLNRSKAIEMMFGKFQFARISALFDNLGRAGSQTNQVFELMGASTQKLAKIAERELNVITESASGQWARAVESIKANMAKLGESIIPFGTMLLNAVNNVVEAFNNIPEGFKSFILFLGAAVAVAGPLIMITGVLANFGGYLVKLFAFLRHIRTSGVGAFEYLTPEIVAAKQAGDLLATGFEKTTSATDRMSQSIRALIAELQALAAAQVASTTPAAASSTTVGRLVSAKAAMASAASTYAAPAAAAVPLLYSAMPFDRASGRNTEFRGLERSHYAPSSVLQEMAKTDPVLLRAGVTKGDITSTAIMASIVPSREELGSQKRTSAAGAQQNAKARVYSSTIFQTDDTTPNPTEFRERGLQQMGLYSGGAPRGSISTGDARRLLPQAEDFKATQLRYVASIAALAREGDEQLHILSKRLRASAGQIDKDSTVFARILDEQVRGLGISEKQLQTRVERMYAVLKGTFDKAIAQGKTTDEAMLAAAAKGLAIEKRTGITDKVVRASDGELVPKYMGFTTAGKNGLQSALLASIQLEHEQQLATQSLTVAKTQATAATTTGTASEGETVASKRQVTVGNKKYTLLLNKQGEVLEASRISFNHQTVTTKAGTRGMDNLLRVINLNAEAQARMASAATAAAAATKKSAWTSPVITPLGKKDPAGEAAAGGRGRMMGAMAGLGALSMIPMMLPDTGNASMETAKTSLSGAGMGAMMGMMAGPVGAGIGAAIGASIPLLTKLVDKMGEAERTYKSLTSVGEAASQKFSTSITTLSDVSMTGLVDNTKAAKTAVEELANAFRSAADGSQDKNFIDALASTSNLNDLQGLLRDKTITWLASGMKAEDINVAIAAALEAAGKRGFAPEVKLYLDNFHIDKGAGEIVQDKINDLMNQSGSSQIASKRAEITALENKLKTTNYTSGLPGQPTVNQLMLDEVLLGNMRTQLAAMTAEAEGPLAELASVLSTMASSMPVDEFMALAGSLNTSNLSAEDFVNSVQNMDNVSQEAKDALAAMTGNGASTEQMLQAIALRNADIITSWSELASLPPARLRVMYEIYTTQQSLAGNVADEISKALAAKQAAKPGPVDEKAAEEARKAADEAAQKRIQDMQDASQARQEAFDAQKEKVKGRYDTEIQKIKDLEDARQKAFDREKKIADRQKQLYDMQVGYREALAGGNFGQAALIQNNIETSKKQWTIDDNAEASKDATTKRVKALEKERDAKLKAIEAAAKADKKASDAAIKNAQAAAKAQREASEKTSKSVINDTTKWQGKIKEALELSKTDFGKGMAALQQIGKDSGLEMGGIMKQAFRDQFGGAGDSIYAAIGQNLQDAPWDKLAALVAAKAAGDIPGAKALLAEIVKWTPGPSAVGGAASTDRQTPGQGQSRNPNREGGYWQGGHVRGLGSDTSDSIPARLSTGEFVHRASAVKKYGVDFMKAINEGKYDPGFAAGGLVGAAGAQFAKAAIMGLTKAIVTGGLPGGSARAGTGISGDVPPADNNISGNRVIGKRLAAARGWGSGSQWNALNYIFDHESGWSTTAYDPGQGDRRDPVDPRARLTWGIPQANPAHKMASAGPDWFDNPATQIKWGLGYIKGRYTDPLGAYAFGRGEGRRLGREWGWYAEGGLVGADGRRFKIEKLGNLMAWVNRPKPRNTNSGSSGAAPAPAPTPGSSVVPPVGTRYVTNGTRYNRGGDHAEGWLGQYQSGVNDIDASVGTPFRALIGGKVTFAKQLPVYPPGYIVVRSGNTEIRYAHARVKVDEGDTVRAGQVIGEAATTNQIPVGRSMTSPHLHFAWRNNSKLIQRQSGYVPWLDDRGSLIKMAGGGLVNAQLLSGEYVMNRAATKKYGGIIEAMNNQRYHTGGKVTEHGPKRDQFASGAGMVHNTYNIDVDARGSDLSAQEVSDLVIKSLKAKESRKGVSRR